MEKGADCAMTAEGAACPSTTAQVIVRGANAVCGIKDAGVPVRVSTSIVLGAGLGLACALALARRRGLGRAWIAALVFAAIAVAAPGARAVLMQRPDAPLRAPASGAEIQRFIDDLSAYAAAHDSCLAEVRNDDCLECQPVLRFVLPARTPCPHPSGRIILGPDAVARGCAVRGDALECGAPL
jgi:hypothetical protein